MNKREALERIRDNSPVSVDKTALIHWIDEVQQIANDALGDTDETPEMMRTGVMFEDSGMAGTLQYGDAGEGLLCVNTDRIQLNVYKLTPDELSQLEGQQILITMRKVAQEETE